MELREERTPQVIAMEINNYIGYNRKTRLMCAIEIGKRLVEAKALVPHGEWYKWLEENVHYSNSTASRLMQIYREYGPAYFPLPEGTEESNSNRAALYALTYTHALILIDVPEDERAELIARLDIEGTTTRELKKIIEERQALQKEKKQFQQEKEQFQKEKEENPQEVKEIQIVLADEQAKSTQLAGELESLKTETQKLEESKKKLEQSYNTQTVIRLGKRLDEAYQKAMANKIPYLLGDLEETFGRLVQEMKEFAVVGAETYDLYRKRVHSFLVKALEAVALVLPIRADLSENNTMA